MGHYLPIRAQGERWSLILLIVAGVARARFELVGVVVAYCTLTLRPLLLVRSFKRVGPARSRLTGEVEDDSAAERNVHYGETRRRDGETPIVVRSQFLTYFFLPPTLPSAPTSSIWLWPRSTTGSRKNASSLTEPSKRPGGGC